MEFDFEEIRKKLEYCNFRLLESYFNKGFTDNFAQQLNNILQQQFDSNHFQNVEGSVFYRADDLELKVIVPEYIRFAEQALEQLAAGKNTNLELLSEFAGSVYQQLSAGAVDHSEDGKKVVEALNSVLERIKKGKRFSSETMKEFARQYKNVVLRQFFIYDPKDFEVRDEDFRALFMVNANAEKPGQTEISLNAKTRNCILTVSAGENYQQKGLSLYLVHAGTSELLYQGPLKENRRIILC